MGNYQRVTDVAAGQTGAISLHQLQSLGIDHNTIQRWLGSGRLQRSLTAFVLPGAPPSWRRDLMCAVLAGGPGAVAGHRSAASLWGFNGCRSRRVEIVVPRWDRRVTEGLNVHESRVIRQRDRDQIQGIPVTTPTFTLLEMARYTSDSRLGIIIDDAATKGLTTYESVQRRFAQTARRGRSGTARLRRVLLGRPGGTVAPGSPLELMVEQLLVDRGLPAPHRQFAVSAERSQYSLDLAWPDERFGIECDGFKHHSTPSSLDRDETRRNDLQSVGWMINNATWKIATQEPDRLASQVRQILNVRRPKSPIPPVLA